MLNNKILSNHSQAIKVTDAPLDGRTRQAKRVLRDSTQVGGKTRSVAQGKARRAAQSVRRTDRNEVSTNKKEVLK